MKERAMDESLSEEARESAKRALDVLVSSELLDIEQTTALKRLESETRFMRQKAQAEREQAEAESETERKKAEAAAEAERKKDRSAARVQVTMELEAGVEAEMLEWLKRHRLPRHADTIARVAGLDAAPCDLQYLTEENVAEIGSDMTHIERMRLQAALQTLGGKIDVCTSLATAF